MLKWCADRSDVEMLFLLQSVPTLVWGLGRSGWMKSAALVLRDPFLNAPIVALGYMTVSTLKMLVWYVQVSAKDLF